MAQGEVWAATGHRPDKLGGYEMNPWQIAIGRKLSELILAGEPRGVISGMALGVDQLFAWAAVENGVPFVAAVPFPGQERAWPIRAQSNYHRLLALAKKVIYVSEGHYSAEKMQIRNKWMVDHCNTLVAVWDGSDGGTANCVHYATSVNRKILRVHPADLKA